MTWFGEYPNGIKDSIDSFLDAITNNSNEERELKPFSLWSNHRRDWFNGDWKNIPRVWKENSGWKVLNKGAVTSEIVVANLNTLMSADGTGYFPDIDGKIFLYSDLNSSYKINYGEKEISKKN